ncbi:hypothetical protein HKX48_007651 [Thoreauomyces humboldtii]|nr:hypothetical protein HKX48_007651 [Thoreauomyces humboldtii]
MLPQSAVSSRTTAASCLLLRPSITTAASATSTCSRLQRFPPSTTRSITVRAARAAAKVQQELQRLAERERRERDMHPGYRPASSVANAPVDVQRAVHVLRSAVKDQNLTVAMANYRALRAKNATAFLDSADLAGLIARNGERLADAAWVPGDPELKALASLFSTYRAARSRSGDRADVAEAAEDVPTLTYADVATVLLRAYARRQNTSAMDDVWSLVMEDVDAGRTSPPVAFYNAAIELYVRDGALASAETVYGALVARTDLVPDATTYAALIKARAAAGQVGGCVELTERWMATGDKPQIKVFNSLLMAFRKERNTDAMTVLLAQLDANDIMPNIITYNVLVDAYAKTGQQDKALAVVARMREDADSKDWRSHCAPDIFTNNTLIDMFVADGNLDAAVAVFDAMPGNGVNPDAVTFTTLMNGFRKQNDLPKVEEYFTRMTYEFGVAHSASPYSVLINAYGAAGDAKRVKQCYDDLLANGVTPNRLTYRSLIRAHEKLGDADGAARWYWEMRRRSITPDHGCLVSAMRSQIRFRSAEAAKLDQVEHATVAMEAVAKIYKDAHRVGRANTPVCNQFLSAKLLTAHSVADAVEAVFREEFLKRDITPDSLTLEMLLAHIKYMEDAKKDASKQDVERFRPLLNLAQAAQEMMTGKVAAVVEGSHVEKSTDPTPTPSSPSTSTRPAFGVITPTAAKHSSATPTRAASRDDILTLAQHLYVLACAKPAVSFTAAASASSPGTVAADVAALLVVYRALVMAHPVNENVVLHLASTLRRLVGWVPPTTPPQSKMPFVSLESSNARVIARQARGRRVSQQKG